MFLSGMLRYNPNTALTSTPTLTLKPYRHRHAALQLRDRYGAVGHRRADRPRGGRRARLRQADCGGPRRM